ncbi:hypothetical protein [Campylobacter fetus]|uniref:hypothetical protein n=1 Tax=Campylobacter fetus TaxID=196 RepID=UPI0013016369|nr:hypothetical protein [Campylobacter fetus]
MRLLCGIIKSMKIPKTKAKKQIKAHFVSISIKRKPVSITNSNNKNSSFEPNLKTKSP